LTPLPSHASEKPDPAHATHWPRSVSPHAYTMAATNGSTFGAGLFGSVCSRRHGSGNGSRGNSRHSPSSQAPSRRRSISIRFGHHHHGRPPFRWRLADAAGKGAPSCSEIGSSGKRALDKPQKLRRDIAITSHWPTWGRRAFSASDAGFRPLDGGRGHRG
jgi:hypothetical protein